MNTKLTLLCGLGLSALTVLAGENLLKNGGFEQLDDTGKQFASWRPNFHKAEGLISVDAENKSEGKESVQIEMLKQLEPHGFSSINQTFWFSALPTQRKLQITLKVSAVELTAGSLIVIGGAAKQQTLWKRLADWKGTFEWKPVTLELEVPAGLTYLGVSLRNSGPGVLWCDDVRAEWIETAAATAKTE